MANTLETINGKLQAWMRCWGAVTLTPRSFFRPSRQPQAISTFEFFTGNYLLAYLLLFLGSILFFFLYYHDRLLSHTAAKAMSGSLALATGLFAVFVLLSFIFVFFSSLITLLVAKAFGSDAPLNKHVNSFLLLSSIEPVAMFGLAIFILANSSDNNHPIPVAVQYTGIAIWAIARLWSLVAAFFAVSNVHPLSFGRRVGLYFVGFLPAFLVLQTCIATFVSLFLALVIIPGWD